MGAGRLVTGDSVEIAKYEGVRDESSGVGAHGDAIRRRYGHKPRCEIYRLAVRHIVVAQPTTDYADCHRTAVHAGPHSEVDAVSPSDIGAHPRELLPDLDRGAKRTHRVMVGHLIAGEQRHNAVSEELIDAAAVPMDDIENDVEGALHDRANILGIELLGDCREAADINEHYGRLLALAPGGEDGATSAAKFLLDPRGLPTELTARSDGRFRGSP